MLTNNFSSFCARFWASTLCLAKCSTWNQNGILNDAFNGTCLEKSKVFFSVFFCSWPNTRERVKCLSSVCNEFLFSILFIYIYKVHMNIFAAIHTFITFSFLCFVYFCSPFTFLLSKTNDVYGVYRLSALKYASVFFCFFISFICIYLNAKISNMSFTVFIYLCIFLCVLSYSFL